jgi:hypothetical protein
MKAEIRRVRNGVLLRVEPDEGGDGAEEYVYQETEFGGTEAFAEFLRLLLNEYGPASSRYSPQRIHVIVEPGDKYEPPGDSGATT